MQKVGNSAVAPDSQVWMDGERVEPQALPVIRHILLSHFSLPFLSLPHFIQLNNRHSKCWPLPSLSHTTIFLHSIFIQDMTLSGPAHSSLIQENIQIDVSWPEKIKQSLHKWDRRRSDGQGRWQGAESSGFAQHMYLGKINVTNWVQDYLLSAVHGDIDKKKMLNSSFLCFRLLNANKINCLRVNTFQDLQNLNLLSLYDNKLQTISKGLFAPLRSIKTL